MALGTWGLSGDGYGPVSEAEQDAVIDRSAALGISLFDTADVYASGEMERRLGNRLKDRAKSTVIVTRIGTDRSDSGAKKHFDEAYLRTAFDKSQNRLVRSPVDVVLLHNPSAVTLEMGEATGFMKSLKDKGEIRAWGASVSDESCARAAIDAGAQVLSVPYNIFYSRVLHAIAGDVAMKGITILVHSVLSYGLLTAHWSAQRSFDDSDHRKNRWSKAELRRRVEQLSAIKELIGGEVLSPRAAALRFALANNLVASTILGPKTPAQLEQLLREAGPGPTYLTDIQLRNLAKRLLEVGVHS